MYQVEASKALLKPRTWMPSASRVSVPRNVLLLGVVSMLTDISSEMVATVLPLYLIFSLGVTPLVLGAINGLYEGAAAVVQVSSGFVSDRWQKHKDVATFGYGLSAVTKIGLVVAGSSVGGIGILVAADRIGKGIRTAPRDALISLSSAKENLATSFGVHRALDSAGAMLGPLVAFGILLVAPARFDAVFVISTLFAFLGLAVLVLAVKGRPERAPKPGVKQSLRMVAAGVLRERGFRLLLLAAGGLAVASISDTLLYVGLQKRTEFDTTIFPLLYVVTAIVFMVLAIPAGRLADRIGRVPVMLGGHALLLPVYVLMLTSTGMTAVWVSLIAIGAYYAATEGVTTALASAILPEQFQATGIGVLITVISIGQFASSLAFGALWYGFGLQEAVLIFAIALVVILALATPLLVRVQREPVSE